MKYELSRPLAIYEIGQRENQEDCIYPAKGMATELDRMFVLCDGMGGHQAGEVASQTVCKAVSEYIVNHADAATPFTDEMLYEAVNKAYDALDDIDTMDSGKKPGTTFVLLYFHAGGLMAAHLGDSRYYHIRPRTAEIRYRSRDHSLAATSFETGEVSLEEMKTMSGRNVVLRAMLPHQEERDLPDIVHIKDIKPDDWFYMCSDGMLENMNDGELLNILSNKELSNEQKCNWLVTSTDENKDNHSAYLIHVVGVMSELIDEGQPDDEAKAREANKVFLAEQNVAAAPVIERQEKQQDEVPLVIVEPGVRPSAMPMPPASNAKPIPAWKWAVLAAIIVVLGLLAWQWLGTNQPREPENPTIIYKEYNAPKTYKPKADEQPIRSSKSSSAEVASQSSRASAASSKMKGPQKAAAKAVKAVKPESEENPKPESEENPKSGQEEQSAGKNKPGFHIESVKPRVDMDGVKKAIKEKEGKKSDNSTEKPKSKGRETESTKDLKEA